MTEVLIADRTHSVLEERLREAGFEVRVEPDHDYESLAQAVQGCEGLVVRSKVIIDKEFIDRAPKLRCIGRVGAGMETIDVEYAEGKGVRCLNSPEGNRDAVGEHTVGLLLALLNNIARADAEVRFALSKDDLKYSIIGYGNMGQAFAKRLAGFGCGTVVYDKYKEIGSLQEVQEKADVVSFHVPLTDETRHYLDAQFIENMARPFFLLNTSRGAVVDTEALVAGLESGKVRGAALDVLEYENMQADGLGDVPECVHYLQRSSRTVLTPHVAGWTVESKYKLAAVLADKMIEVLK